MYVLVYIFLFFISAGQAYCSEQNKFCNQVYPAFLDSMSTWSTHDRNRAFDKQMALNNKYAQKAKEYYENFWLNGLQVSIEPRIPKIIHQIWLGSPFPEKYRRLQQSWLQHHPDWKYILWTEKELAEFGLLNQEIFDKATNYGQKSDIARYEILFRMGGLYIDTDFECIKSFDIFHNSLDFYTSCIPEQGGSLTLLNGLLAACPGHPILKTCVERLKNINPSGEPNSIMASTGPYFFTRCVYDNLSPQCGRLVIFPISFFYPLNDTSRFQNLSLDNVVQRFVKDESFAIHWWNCSWQKA